MNQRAIPFELGRAALLVVDVQQLFTSVASPAHIPAFSTVIANINKILPIFRQAQRPIVFTRWAGRTAIMERFWRHLLDPQEELAQLDQRLDTGDDPVLLKNSYSCFSGTNLKTLLQGVEQVVIVGGMTHLCCDMAARESFEYGMVPFLPADALVSNREELHRGALAAAAHGYAIVCTVSDLR